MQSEGIHAELIARYQAGNYRSALALFGSLAESDHAQLTAESRQTIAQCYGRLGDLPSACVKFIEAAVGHIAARSPNASICLTNASLMLDSQNCSDASEWLGLFALQLPAPCDAQIALLQSMLTRYQQAALNDKNRDLLWATLAAAGRFASTRSSAHATLLSLATVMEPTPEIASVDARHSSPNTAGELISIIVCSHRDDGFAGFERECRAAFSAGTYEVIRISDAQSMCEGYNRGAKFSSGDVLIFCHDDIEFLSDDAGDAIKRALKTADVVVAVGASACDGPAWWAAPVEAYQGWIAYSPEPGRYGVCITGIPNAREQLVCGDGFLIACNRAVAEAMPWDEATLTGFHLYDVDFLARAAVRYRVAALRDVMICHQSGGAYDNNWQEAAQRFLAQHGGVMRAVPPDDLWTCGALYSRSEAARVARNLANKLPLDWVGVLVSRADAIKTMASEQCPAIYQLQHMNTQQTLLA